MHIVGSYAGQIGVFVTADREMLPDIDTYMACLEQSYRDLLAMADVAAAERHPARSASGSPVQIGT